MLGCLLLTLIALAQAEQSADAPPQVSSHKMQEMADTDHTPPPKLVDALRKSILSRTKASKTIRGRNTSADPPSTPVPVPNPFPALYHPAERQPGQCPNVVLIILDTLRADRLGCYGFNQPTSPKLDALAATGVRFEHVLTQSTWTRPSIGSFLTSRFPRELGIYLERDQILPDRFVTLAEALKAHGYKTIGLTANPNINTTFNFQQGFDEYVDSNVVFSWMRADDGEIARGVTPLPDAPDMFQKALTVVEATGNEGPYYLQFNFMEVHEWVANRPGTNMLREDFANLFSEHDPYVKYLRLIRQVTEDINRFVDRLTDLPGWEDTLFVVVSDHGEGLGDHSRVALSSTHGNIVYESVTRVPWIMFRKGWTPKQGVISQEVRMLDMMPTVLDMVGATPPEGMQGISLLPMINGERKVMPMPRYHVIETEFGNAVKVAVYGRRFIYIENRTLTSGLSLRELQYRGARANGAATDVQSRYTEVSEGMQDFLRTWELEFPKQPPTAPIQAISDDELDQLKGIGYL